MPKLWCALLSLSLAGFTAQAEEADTTLSTVVVTDSADPSSYNAPEYESVSQSALPLQETPMSVQVIGQQVLQDQQADTLGDALRNVSGVNQMYYIGGGYERFIVRGFEQSLTTYRNGIQLPFQRYQAANTERVEVLKGPSAAEYGMSDPGGVINIVTKAPSAERTYEIEQTVGAHDNFSSNSYQTQLGATGALTADDALLYRMDFSYQNADGYRELTDTENFFIAPSLHWNISQSTRANLAFEYETADQVYDSGQPAVGDGLADLPVDRSFGQKGLSDEYTNRLLDLNIEHELNDTWKLSAGAVDFKNTKDYRSFYMYADLQPGDQLADRYAWFGPEDFDTRSLWANLAGEFNTGAVTHHVMTGVQYSTMDGTAAATDEYVDTVNIYTYQPSQSHVNLSQYENMAPAFTSKQHDDSLGFFVQDQMELTEKLNLQISIRHDKLDRELYAAYFSPVTYSEADDSQTSPRVGALYAITPSLSVFAHYSESFGPGFNYEPSALYEPESAKQYEVGIKKTWLDNRVTTSASLYDLTKKNLPTPDPNNPNMTVAIGEANSQGMELDMQGEITPALSLIANYAYNNSEITKDNAGNEGNALPNAPQNQASVWLKYAFLDGDLRGLDLRGLSVGGGPFMASSRYGDAANSYEDSSYLRWDMFSAYTFAVADSEITAQININNITDEEYYTMRARWTNLPAEQRSVVASLRATF